MLKIFNIYLEKLKYETDLFSLLFYDKAENIGIKDIYIPIDERIFKQINDKQHVFFHITDKKGIEYLKKTQYKKRNPISCFRNINDDLLFETGISDSVKPEYIAVLNGISLFSSLKDMISIPSYKGIRRLISLNSLFPEEENKLYRKFIKFRESLNYNRQMSIIKKGKLISKIFDFWNTIIIDRFDYIKKTSCYAVKKSNIFEQYDEHLVTEYKILNIYKISDFNISDLKKELNKWI